MFRFLYKLVIIIWTGRQFTSNYLVLKIKNKEIIQESNFIAVNIILHLIMFSGSAWEISRKGLNRTKLQNEYQIFFFFFPVF